MIHSIIVTNIENYIIFSQYYEPLSNEEKAEWNQNLFEITQHDFNSSMPREQACMIGDNVCVFCQANDARFFITGREDELICFYLLIIVNNCVI
jgi:hypothetical protein